MANVGFREIADGLQERIRSGDLAPGAPVPSESALASEYGVSRTTARRALVALEEKGLIQGGAGRVRAVRSSSSAPRSLARYEQIAAVIRAEIDDGTLRPGQQVGTESFLAARFDVSPGTVRRALQELANDGAVTGVSGRGWFVMSEDGPPTRTSETASAIREGIRSGEWAIGARLPGELALAERFGVARITVRRAFDLLESEGLIGRVPGIGRTVLRGSA
ncbi:GntR family transcriptional regulator [Actinomadura montaniterrae]|uniref:GntR family transcriptional regulator n=1 Tax=Actinomadura montaniterrae TaxID=1803903 RepID=A0A6L3VJK4_9ACTN|nr:GntR family transcriptional regulator [Actinomadura montaniterrae]KAB2371135.1 GntR family transcriptional regulator [Actinomadura montaniterrae]